MEGTFLRHDANAEPRMEVTRPWPIWAKSPLSKPQELPVSLGPAYDAKEQIRQATDIVDLVGADMSLRRQGRNYVAICPWHDDSRPSLQVNPDRQSWKCWVCDVGGDIFSWVERREGVSFMEAKKMLADRAGIELSAATNRPAAQPGSPGDKQTLYSAVAWAEKQFCEFFQNSPEAEAARRYVADRGITTDSITQFRVGYAPPSFQWLCDRAKTTQFSVDVLQAAGLINVQEKSGRPYDFFRGRVMFPIRDTQKRVIAFGGRILPELAAAEEKQRGQTPGKYINSRESRLFQKSNQLYALEVAADAVRKHELRQLVVVEGYTDVIMAHQTGMGNVVAACGTALNDRHIGLLRRFADRVTLVLDGDEAGKSRTNQLLELFVAADIDLQVMTLPDGLDPFDFLRQHGAEPFQKMLAGAKDALEHKVAVELHGVDLARDTHRASHALDNILQTIAKAPRMQRSAEGSTRLREQQILARLARQFRIDESQLRVRLNELRRRSKSRATRAPEDQPAPPLRLSNLNPKETELLEILILHPELTETADEGINPSWLTPVAKVLFETFQRIHNSGEPASFERVMTQLEDARLKSLLVAIDERAQAKAEQVQEEAPSRLRGLIDTFLDQEAEVVRREKLASLEESNLNQQEELDILNQLIEQKRNRQGISEPTDG